MTRRRRDEGHTLIELLLVIVVLALVATIVVAAVGGFAAEAESSSCEADEHILATATEAYFAQRSASVLPPVGASADRFELELVGGGFLHAPSHYYDLDASGKLIQSTGSPCTP
jgi:prepilin-type N-terminal cleavage/methylation domain-containing protein